MKRMLSMGSAFLLSLGILGCDEGSGPPPPPPLPSLATPIPKLIVVRTTKGYYAGTIVNDQQPAAPAPAVPAESPADAPKGGAEATSSGAVRVSSDSVAPGRVGNEPIDPRRQPAEMLPPAGSPSLANKDEPPKPPDALQPLIGDYRADNSIGFRFPSDGVRDVIGVTKAGEVVFARPVTGTPGKIPGYALPPGDPAFPSNSTRVSIWNPTTGIASEVVVLQHRAGSAKGSRPLAAFDRASDSLFFLQDGVGGVTRLIKRTLGDGKEEEIFAAPALVFAGEYGDPVRIVAGRVLVGRGADVFRDYFLLDLGTKEAKPVCDLCVADWLVGPDGKLIYARTGDGKWLVGTPDGAQTSPFANATDAAGAPIAVRPLRFLKASNALLFSRTTIEAGAEAPSVTEIVAFSLTDGATKTIVKTAWPVAADYKTGPKIATAYHSVIAQAGDRYLLAGGDYLCKTAASCGDDSQQLTYLFALVGSDGVPQVIKRFDWPAFAIAYAAGSDRLVVDSWGDVNRLLVLNANDGGELAALDRAQGKSVVTHSQSFNPSVFAIGDPATDAAWEEGRFFFTLVETGLPGESTLGVLGLHQIDTVTGALAPTALAKIQGSGATIFLADRTGMGAREAGVVADATPIPDATSGGSQPPYVNPPEPPPPPPASGLTLSSVNFAAGAQHLVMMPNTEQKSMVATLPDGSFPAVQVTSAPAQAVKLTINCDKTIGSGAQVANWSGSAPFALTPNPTAKQDLLIKYTYTGDAPAGGTLGKCTAIATGADGTTSNEVAILFKIGELPKPIVAGGAPGLKPNNFIKGYVCQYSAEKAVACATKAQNFAGIYKPQIVVSTAEGETATLEIVSCSSAGWSFDKAGSGVKLLGKAVGLPSPAFVHELDIRYIPKGAAAGTAESCDLKATSSAGKAATLTVPLEWHVVPTQLPSSPVIDQATAPSIMGLPPTYGLVEKGATVTIEGITITAVGGIKDVAVECDHAELRPTVKKAAENKYTLGVKVGTSDTTCSLTATSNGNASKTAQIVIQVKSQASGGAIGTSTLKIVPFKGGTSAFSPKELTIPVGSKGNLMITNEDTIDHTFTTEPPHVDVRVYKGTSVLVTIPTDKAGEIPFHCGIHPTMKGKIIIK